MRFVNSLEVSRSIHVRKKSLKHDYVLMYTALRILTSVGSNVLQYRACGASINVKHMSNASVPHGPYSHEQKHCA